MRRIRSDSAITAEDGLIVSSRKELDVVIDSSEDDFLEEEALEDDLEDNDSSIVEEDVLLKRAYEATAELTSDDEESSSSSAISSTVIASDDDEFVNQSKAPETPQSIDAREWSRGRQHFFAAARTRERVLSDEENEYEIPPPPPPPITTTIINMSNNDMFDVQSTIDGSRNEQERDDYYHEGDSIFSEDSHHNNNDNNAQTAHEFFNKSASNQAHFSKSAEYNNNINNIRAGQSGYVNPFTKQHYSTTTTTTTTHDNNNNNNNNNKLYKREIESDIGEEDEEDMLEDDDDDDDIYEHRNTMNVPLLSTRSSPTKKMINNNYINNAASPNRKKKGEQQQHQFLNQSELMIKNNFVPLRARDVLEHSADFYDTSLVSGLPTFEVMRRLRKFGPNTVLTEKFNYSQLVKHAFREFNAPAGRVIFLAIFLQSLQAMDPAKTLDSIIDVLVLLLVFFANCYVGWSESRDDGSLMTGTEDSRLTSLKKTGANGTKNKQTQKQILENMTTTNAPRNGQFPAYATVVRDNGKQMRVSSRSLVPGDIVELRVGLIVPCDCVYRGSGVLFVTRNSNYLINTAATTNNNNNIKNYNKISSPRITTIDDASMFFGDFTGQNDEMDSLDLIGVSEGEPILGGSIIYAGCGAAIVGRTGPRTAIARKMIQIRQAEEKRAYNDGIFGFFSTPSSTNSNRSKKQNMKKSKSFGSLFGTTSPRRRPHITSAITVSTVAAPRGSAFDRSIDKVMTGVAAASFASAFSLWLFLVVAGRGFWFACSFATVLCVCALPIAVRVVVHATVALGIRRMAKARASPGYNPGLDDYYPEYYLTEQSFREQQQHFNLQQRRQESNTKASVNPLSGFLGSTTTRTFGISRLSAIQDVASMQALFCSTSCCVVDRFATKIVGEPIVFADSCQPRDVLVAAALASRWWKNSSAVAEAATPTTARSGGNTFNNMFDAHFKEKNGEQFNFIFDDPVDAAIAERLAQDGLSSLSETYIQKTYEPYDSVVKLSRATISRDEAVDGSNSGVFAVAKGCLESIDNLVRRETMISRAGNEDHAKTVFKALDEAKNREKMFERRGLRCIAVACAYDVQTTAEMSENSAQNQGSIVNGWVFLGIFAFSRQVRQDCNAGRDALRALGVDVKLFTSASESFAKVRIDQLHNPKRVLSTMKRTGNTNQNGGAPGEEFASTSILDNQDTDSELLRSENVSNANVSPRVQSFYTNAGKRYEGVIRNSRDVLEGRMNESSRENDAFVSNDAEKGGGGIRSNATTRANEIVAINQVDCFCECSNAETKANIIRRFKQSAMMMSSTNIRPNNQQRYSSNSRKVIVGVLGDRLEDLPAMRASDAAFAALQSSTDAAVRVADFVISKPSLAHVASAIVEARAVFARAKTYVLYRIICTFHLLAVFVLCAFLIFPNETNVAWPKTFTLPVIALALLASVNDCVVLSIAYDFARPSASPEAWRLPCILASGLAMGFVATFTTCFVAREIFSSANANFGLLEALDIAPDSYEQAKCMIFLKMALTDAFSVLCARSDGPNPFWTLAPGGFLFMATMASSFASILLTRHWPFHEMSPCTFEQTLFCIAVALLSFLLQDASKTIAYRALVRAEWMPERRRLSSAETKRISAVAARDIDLERREALKKVLRAATKSKDNEATGASFTPRHAPMTPPHGGQRTPTAANDAAFFKSATKFNSSPHKSPFLSTTVEGDEEDNDAMNISDTEEVSNEDKMMDDDLSSIDDDDDSKYYGNRPTSLYDSPAEEPETVLQKKLCAEKSELSIGTFTRLTFGYRSILDKELKQLTVSIDWSRAFRDLRRAKADLQAGALLDAHATLRCLDADCGVGSFSMMLAEKLAAKKLRNNKTEKSSYKNKNNASKGKDGNGEDDSIDSSSSDDDELVDGSDDRNNNNNNNNMKLKSPPSSTMKKKKSNNNTTTVVERLASGKNININNNNNESMSGRVVAVELLSSSLVCLKHALEEINENDIDSPFRAVALHRGTLDVFKVKPMSYDVAYNAFGFERIQKGASLRAAARAFAMSVKTNGLGFIAVHVAKSADCRFHQLYRNAFIAPSSVVISFNENTTIQPAMTTAEDVIEELHRLGVAYNVTTKSYQLRIEKIGEYNRRILEMYLHGVAMDDSLTLEEICSDANVARFLSENDRGDCFQFTQIVAHITL
jgi:magnesium-transporting ATPase (P-type)